MEEQSQARETSLLVELSNDLAAAVEKTEPSIVSVDARQRYGATGLIWRADGMIVTADHTVEREDEITVGLPGGERTSARIVGRDPGTDIAVLTVDADGLTAVQGVRSEVRVGHLVLALGRPHGEAAMASLGVVSAVGGPWRSWRGGQIERLIRSDVTLYPGFSGGPLVDASGEVVGLNTSILARGLATTLPWSLVEGTARALVDRGSIGRGYLGVVTQPVELPESLRQTAAVEHSTALLIAGIEPGSSAERAGLLLGDIIFRLGERPITGVEALQTALGPGSAGSQQPIRVIRAGRATELTVTIGER